MIKKPINKTNKTQVKTKGNKIASLNTKPKITPKQEIKSDITKIATITKSKIIINDKSRTNLPLKKKNYNDPLDLYVRVFSLKHNSELQGPNKFKRISNNLFNYVFDFLSRNEVYTINCSVSNKRLMEYTKQREM